MALTLFRGNKQGTGAMISISPERKEGESLFIKLTKQTGYDETKHLSTFKGGDFISANFNMEEIGQLINTLERDGKWEGYHSVTSSTGKKKGTKIIFGVNKTQTGYGIYFSQTIDENKLAISAGFDFGTGVLIREYLKNILNNIFLLSDNYSESKVENQPNEAKDLTVNSEEDENLNLF